MATITIRNLPDEVRDKLRVVAAKNGRSMEAEARAVLTTQLADQPEKAKVEDVRQRLKRVQADFAKHLPRGRDLSAEFLAERKRMWGDE